MSRKFIIIMSIVVVAVTGGMIALARYNSANLGIPRFYVWKKLGGQFKGGEYANVNGVKIYHETYGEGPPVLLLHGAFGSVEWMHTFIPALSADHKVLAVDSRGQGRSSDGPDALTYTQMGQDMIALLDSLKIEQVDVVGYSDGGIIGLDMAMKHPKRVRRLVVMGSNYDTSGTAHIDSAAMEGFVAWVKPFYESIAPDPSHFPVIAEKLVKMMTTEPNYTIAELGQIQVPVLVVAGEHDLILREHTDNLAAAIPGSKKIIVLGATHFGHNEQPDVYNEIVLKFLSAP